MGLVVIVVRLGVADTVGEAPSRGEGGWREIIVVLLKELRMQ